MDTEKALKNNFDRLTKPNLLHVYLTLPATHPVRDTSALCNRLLSNSGLVTGLSSKIKHNKVIFLQNEQKEEAIINTYMYDSLEDEGIDYIVFELEISGNTNVIHQVRAPLLDSLREFCESGSHKGQINVLFDSISLKIARKLYPEIYFIENRLRSFLVRYFVLNLGHDWFNLTADPEMKEKVRKRPGFKNSFDFIEDYLYKIDLNDIAKILFRHSYANMEKKDIINKILEIDPEDPNLVEKISRMKRDILPNRDKFFEQYVPDRGKFQEKMEYLVKIRNKIAHNGLFTADEEKKVLQVVFSTNDILIDAEKNLFTSKNNTLSRRQNIEQNMNIILNEEAIKVPTIEIILEQLEYSEAWAEDIFGYVTLNAFIYKYLGKKLKYNPSISMAIIHKELIPMELAKIYIHENPATGNNMNCIKLLDRGRRRLTNYKKEIEEE